MGGHVCPLPLTSFRTLTSTMVFRALFQINFTSQNPKAHYVCPCPCLHLDIPDDVTDMMVTFTPCATTTTFQARVHLYLPIRLSPFLFLLYHFSFSSYFILSFISPISIMFIRLTLFSIFAATNRACITLTRSIGSSGECECSN